MAHTHKGNMKGRAASTDRRDTMEYVRSMQDKEAQKIHEEWERKQDEAIECCITLEGEEAFMKWYSDDNNVPNYGRITERISIIRAHLAGLQFNASYTRADELVGEECANIITIADVAETMEEANG